MRRQLRLLVLCLALPSTVVAQITVNPGQAYTSKTLTVNGTETETITQPMDTTGWSFTADGTGTWSITGGVLSKIASSLPVTALAVSGQSTITGGSTYKVSVTASACTAGVYINFAGVLGNSIPAGAGTTVAYFVAGTSAKFGITGSASSTATITNISVVEIAPGTGVITSGSNISPRGQILAGESADYPAYSFTSSPQTGFGFPTNSGVLQIRVLNNSVLNLNPAYSQIGVGTFAVGQVTSTTTGRLIVSDTSLAGSGSLVGSVLLMTQTWNTTGAPVGIKYSITDTASHAASLAMQISGGAAGTTNLFSVGKTGVVTTGGRLNLGPVTGNAAGGSSSVVHTDTIIDMAAATGTGTITITSAATAVPVGLTMGVSCRVTTILAGAALGTWSIGVAGATDRFGAGLAKAQDTLVTAANYKAATGPFYQQAAAGLVLTGSAGVFSTGVLKCTVTTMVFTPIGS